MEATGAMPAPAGLNVLVVEDDALVAMDIEMNVEEAGHVVIGRATTACEAIDAARRTPPDVVLMDLRLADGSFGGDAARAILREHGVRSIFLSGNLDPETRAKLADLEPIAMINKPFLPHELTRALEAVDETAN